MPIMGQRLHDALAMKSSPTLLALFAASSLVGCATDPIDEASREWPCGSIETGGHYGLANVHARYQYDDLNNVVWHQETNFEQSANYGKVMMTETKTFEGEIAVAEELVAPNWHHKTTRELAAGRIARTATVQYGLEGNDDVLLSTTWTYEGDRVARLDHKDVSHDRSMGYSLYTYPDADTQVVRSCSVADLNGVERCSTETLIGGEKSWTTRRVDDTSDGAIESETVRTLDANGLPLTTEVFDVNNGTRTLRGTTVIERRADGAPLFMDNGFTQTEYLFACE